MAYGADTSGPGNGTVLDRKLLFVSHFSLSRLSGVTVLMSELLDAIPRVHPGIDVAYESFDIHPRPLDMVEHLSSVHSDASCIIAINVHIELLWDHTLALLDWCRQEQKPVYVYVHDYWPHHRDGLRLLIDRYGVRLLASSQIIVDQMSGDVDDVTLVTVGISFANVELGPTVESPGPLPVIASGGRIVRRKRFGDVVRAFRDGGLARSSQLHVRLLPSLVYPPEEDHALFSELLGLVGVGRDGFDVDQAIRLELRCVHRQDYRPYAAYVCASHYEGLSMCPIEAAYSGCPPIMSDIPAHRAIAEALFPDSAATFLYPLGDHDALAEVLDDELRTRRRQHEVRCRQKSIRQTIDDRWSLPNMARLLVDVTG